MGLMNSPSAIVTSPTCVIQSLDSFERAPDVHAHSDVSAEERRSRSVPQDLIALRVRPRYLGRDRTLDLGIIDVCNSLSCPHCDSCVEVKEEEVGTRCFTVRHTTC